MTNTTGILSGLVAASITAVNSMPEGVPEIVKEWLLWVITYVSLISAVFAGATALSKAKATDSTDPKDPPPIKP